MLVRFVFVLSCCVTVPAVGQAPADTSAGPPSEGVDVRMLRAVYASPPAVASVWRAADWSSYKVFFAAPVATGIAAAANAVEPAFAFRLVLAEGAGVVSYYGLKRLFGRERPYRTVAGIRSRRPSGAEELESFFDPYSFPSGHATMAFAVATTYALEARRPAVTIPALVWAGSVAVSRVWLGVHYPSDVIAGSVLGASLAITIYALGDAITPDRLEDDPAIDPVVPLMTIRIPLP